MIEEYRAALNPHPKDMPFEWTKVSLQTLMLEIKDRHFPELEVTPIAFFGRSRLLASICTHHDPVTICISSLLNAPDTPTEVLEFLLIHELLHLIHRPIEINGEMENHPPSFKEHQRRLCPDETLLSSWILYNLDWRVTTRKGSNTILVLKKAYKSKLPKFRPLSEIQIELQSWYGKSLCA